MLRKAMTILLAAMLANVALADTLIVDGIAPAGSADQPNRGATKADVLADLGEPVTRRGAVGEPPISSWEYAGFVVYFEHDYVLHSVAKR